MMQNKLLMFGRLCLIAGFICTLTLSSLKYIPPTPVTDFLQGFFLGLSAVAYIAAIILFTGSFKTRPASKINP